MMRCPRLRYLAPDSIRQVCEILRDHGPAAMVLAGGTDLIPNLKRRQQTPEVLVSLRRVEGLRRIERGEGAIRLGAALTLADLVSEERIRREHSALFRAAAQVATPHLRNMATLGGNLCLDTRCNYYDQNYEWRKAIDFCMKKDGRVCWVAPGSPRCYAVSSTDTAPALVALGAEVTLVSAEGERRIPLKDFYRDDGIRYLSRRPEELLTEVAVPSPAPGVRSTYWKLRRRGSIDFPVLSAAAWIRLDGGGVVREARLVLGSVASRPLEIPAASLLSGGTLDDDSIEKVAEAASRIAKPMDNTDFHLGWRKKAAHHLVAGALRELRGDDPRTLGPFARRAADLLPVG